MAWTTPKTDFGSEVLTAAQMNAIGDNLEFLKDPTTAEYNANIAYSTTSTSFGDVDASNLAQTIICNGGAILVTVNIAWVHATSGIVYFDIDVDGTLQGTGGAGIAIFQGLTSTIREPLTLNFWITGLSAASHTFKLQWRVSAGTGYINLTPAMVQFVVREVS